MMDEIQKRLLAEVADLHGVPEGAYNIRANGQMAAPVRDPQGEKKLERNYIYTVNAVIRYLDITSSACALSDRLASQHRSRYDGRNGRIFPE